MCVCVCVCVCERGGCREAADEGKAGNSVRKLAVAWKIYTSAHETRMLCLLVQVPLHNPAPCKHALSVRS